MDSIRNFRRVTWDSDVHIATKFLLPLKRWKERRWGSIQHYSHVRFGENPLSASKISRITQIEGSWVFYDGFVNSPFSSNRSRIKRSSITNTFKIYIYIYIYTGSCFCLAL